MSLLVLGLAAPGWASPVPGLRWSSHLNNNDLAHAAVDGTTLWFGSFAGGVVEWDTGSNHINTYTRSKSGLPGNAIQDITVDIAGGVWIATSRGLGERPAGADPNDAWITHDTTNSGLTDENVTAVAGDPQGGVWVGTFDGGLFFYDGIAWTHFDTSNSGLSDNFVTSIEIDAAGNKWIGVWGDGVDRFDGLTWTNFDTVNTGTPSGLCFASDPPEQLGLISTFVFVRGIDPVTGEIWFWNDDDNPNCVLSGLSAFDGAAWRTYTVLNSGIFFGTEDVAFDAMGGVWLASLNGIQRLAGGVFTNFDPNTAPDSARSAAAVGNAIWFGTPVGAAKFENGVFTEFPPFGLTRSPIRDLAFRTVGEQTETWVAHDVGVQRFDGQAWELFTPENSPLASFQNAAVAVDLDNSVWIGSGVGGSAVQHIVGDTWMSFTTQNSGLRSTAVADIEVDPNTGQKWFAYRFSGGITRYNGLSWESFISDGSPFGCDAPNGVPGQPVDDIEIDAAGNKWIGSGCGVTVFDDEVWTTFDTQDGLPSNSVRDIAIGLGGEVWAATAEGVSRLQGGQVTAWFLGRDVRTIGVGADGRVWAGIFGVGVAVYDGASWTAYGIDDGLVNDVVRWAVGLHPDGSIWFGTDGGIAVLEAAPDIQAEDVDRSGAVDTGDLTQFVHCISGPDRLGAPGCDTVNFLNADVNDDGATDMWDFARLQVARSP